MMKSRIIKNGRHKLKLYKEKNLQATVFGFYIDYRYYLYHKNIKNVTIILI